jgi:hypothetical protein
MLEPTLHQASGLLGLGESVQTQLIGMVSHGDELAELPLLWRLCSVLVDLGYQVTVLDATKSESDHNPGLEQLLSYRLGNAACEPDAPDWSVIPAARGILQLCQLQTSTLHSLRTLGQLFRGTGVVILHGSADLLVQLLQGTPTRPLLAVSPAKSTLLTSYLALKRLLIQGNLEPIILNMMQSARHSASTPGAGVTTNLSECARNFLGYEVKAMELDPLADEMAVTIAVRHLATCLLETAVHLGTTSTASGTMRATDSMPQFAGSH